MNNQDLQLIGERIGEYTAYTLIILFFTIKTIKTIYNSFSDLFKEKKKLKTDDKNNININVGGEVSENVFSKIDPQLILFLLLQQAKILNALNDLGREILAEQMDYFSRQMRSINIRYTSTICEILSEAGIDDVHFGTYFTNAENFIEVCGYHVTSLFRQMCKENHFSEKTPQEFRELVDKNIYVIDGVLDELLRKRYPQRQIIKSMHKFDKIRSDLRSALRLCFDYARDVAVARETKVKQEQKDFEDEIFKLTGRKYSIT